MDADSVVKSLEFQRLLSRPTTGGRIASHDHPVEILTSQVGNTPRIGRVRLKIVEDDQILIVKYLLPFLLPLVISIGCPLRLLFGHAAATRKVVWSDTNGLRGLSRGNSHGISLDKMPHYLVRRRRQHVDLSSENMNFRLLARNNSNAKIGVSIKKRGVLRRHDKSFFLVGSIDPGLASVQFATTFRDHLHINDALHHHGDSVEKIELHLTGLHLNPLLRNALADLQALFSRNHHDVGHSRYDRDRLCRSRRGEGEDPICLIDVGGRWLSSDILIGGVLSYLAPPRNYGGRKDQQDTDRNEHQPLRKGKWMQLGKVLLAFWSGSKWTYVGLLRQFIHQVVQTSMKAKELDIRFPRSRIALESIF